MNKALSDVFQEGRGGGGWRNMSIKRTEFTFRLHASPFRIHVQYHSTQKSKGHKKRAGGYESKAPPPKKKDCLRFRIKVFILQ